MPFSHRLANEIASRRIKAGLSQEQLVKEAELDSQNYLSRIERNIPDKLSFADAVRIGAVLGMDPNAMAQIAGWWTSPEGSATHDPRVRELLAALPEMDRDTKESLLDVTSRLIVAWRSIAARPLRSASRE